MDDSVTLGVDGALAKTLNTIKSALRSHEIWKSHWILWIIEFKIRYVKNSWGTLENAQISKISVSNYCSTFNSQFGDLKWAPISIWSYLKWASGFNKKNNLHFLYYFIFSYIFHNNISKFDQFQNYSCCFRQSDMQHWKMKYWKSSTLLFRQRLSYRQSDIYCTNCFVISWFDQNGESDSYKTLTNYVQY